MKSDQGYSPQRFALAPRAKAGFASTRCARHAPAMGMHGGNLDILKPRIKIRAFEDTWTWNQGICIYENLDLRPGKISDVIQAFRNFWARAT